MIQVDEWRALKEMKENEQMKGGWQMLETDRSCFQIDGTDWDMM